MPEDVGIGTGRGEGDADTAGGFDDPGRDLDPPHAHVNDPSGARLDINGNPVAPESPEAHLPIGR